MFEALLPFAICGFITILLTILFRYGKDLLRETDLAVLCALHQQDIGCFEQARMRKTITSAALLLLWPLVNYEFYYVGFIAASAVYCYKQPYFALVSKQKKMLRRLRYEFPLWLRQLQILLQNNNVLHALQLSLPRAPQIIGLPLTKMIAAIEQDPISMQPYVRFLEEFEMFEIQRAMKLLYRCHIVGMEESYKQFNRMIEATGKWLRQSRLDRKANHLMVLQWVGMLPLLGVTVMFMIMMAVVILEMMKGGM